MIMQAKYGIAIDDLSWHFSPFLYVWYVTTRTGMFDKQKKKSCRSISWANTGCSSYQPEAGQPRAPDLPMPPHPYIISDKR
jgi:hypothetical protein